MSNPFARDEQSVRVSKALVGPPAVYDDDDEADEDSDFEEGDEPSVRHYDRWVTRPGFGSPEWWSGT